MFREVAMTKSDSGDMMKKMLLGLTVLAVGLQAAVVFAQSGRHDEDRQEAARHGWMFDYSKAKQRARATNRPLMIVFRCVP